MLCFFFFIYRLLICKLTKIYCDLGLDGPIPTTQSAAETVSDAPLWLPLMRLLLRFVWLVLKRKDPNAGCHV